MFKVSYSIEFVVPKDPTHVRAATEAIVRRIAAAVEHGEIARYDIHVEPTEEGADAPEDYDFHKEVK